MESIEKCDLLKSFIIELFENNNPKKLKVDNLHRCIIIHVIINVILGNEIIKSYFTFNFM